MGHFTSIEQSKKLIEAGLNPKTADMWYNYECWIGDEVDGSCMEYGDYSDYPTCVKEEKSVLPCWSAGRLIELTHNILFATPNATCTKYHCYGFDGQLTEIFGDTIIDVLVDMVLHCLKEGIIKKGE